MKNAEHQIADAFQIKIILDGSKPPIWRRFIVPSDINLLTLHHVIQIVMGWTNSHLHEFHIDGERFTEIHPDESFSEVLGSDESTVRLNDLAGLKTKFTYTYDFGDGWQHTLIIEKIIPAADNPETFTCIAGKLACPPEDCGGIWGYYYLLEILNDPDHPEHADRKDWAGNIDPEAFDLDPINKELARLRRVIRKSLRE